MLAVPVRRSGRILGILAVQNRSPRNFTDDEVDDLETVAMLLAEMLPMSGATDGSPEGVGGTVPRLVLRHCAHGRHGGRSGRAAALEPIGDQIAGR